MEVKLLGQSFQTYCQQAFQEVRADGSLAWEHRKCTVNMGGSTCKAETSGTYLFQLHFLCDWQ